MRGGRGPDFERVALRLAGAIGDEDCRLAGGLAVNAYGFVRATRDIDLVVRAFLPDVQRRLREQGIESELFRGDILDGDFPCLRGSCEGVRFDVLPPLVAVDWERGAVVLEGNKVRLRVVPLEALLAFKMKAQGPKDLMDAAMLVLLHPEMREVARDLADSYRARERFEVFLGDPRLAREAEAIRDRPSVPPTKAKRPRRRR